jgi:hypothetical protein
LTRLIDLRLRNDGMVSAYAAVTGLVLVSIGALGFVPNPLVGPADVPIAANALHSAIHLATGLIALYIGLALSGDSEANAVMAFGVLHGVILVLVLVDPTLFGLFGDAPASGTDQLLHVALAVSALAVGYVARRRTERAGST